MAQTLTATLTSLSDPKLSLRLGAGLHFRSSYTGPRGRETSPEPAFILTLGTQNPDEIITVVLPVAILEWAKQDHFMCQGYAMAEQDQQSARSESARKAHRTRRANEAHAKHAAASARLARIKAVTERIRSRTHKTITVENDQFTTSKKDSDQ